MSGVEYIVHQAPAEMAPGTGTGVWVIRKQLRRKRNDGQPDDLTVYADYFVVGYNIYQAPTLADVLSSRITSMAVALSKGFPAMNSMQTWSPARGHVYETTDSAAAGGKELAEGEGEEEEDEGDDDEDDDDDEDEDAMAVDRPTTTTGATSSKPGIGAATANGGGGDDGLDDSDDDDDPILDPRLAEESYAIHMMYGGEYMDEQPISGRPGDFHIALAGGGRSAVGGSAAAGSGGSGGGSSKSATAGGANDSKDGGSSGKATPVSGAAGGKDGKTGGAKTGTTTPAKPKRRKSKVQSAA